MSKSELFEKTKAFVEGTPAFFEAFSELKENREIEIVLDERVTCAASFREGKVNFEERVAQRADVAFYLNTEAVRRLTALASPDLAILGIEICREILRGHIRLKMVSSPTNILTGGYLNIIKKAGPDFLSFLTQHGLSNLFKVIGYIKSLKRH